MKHNSTKPARSIDGIRPASTTSNKKFSNKISQLILHPRFLLTAIIILAILLLIISIIAFRRPTQSGEDEVKQVITEISAHYILPSDETPALATVTDRTKLQTQFFKSAQNGDKILIYQKNKIAIIYRPKIDKIVAVGPVDIANAPTSTPN